MREYGQIQCSFWTDPDIQSVSDQAKALACYLLTGPHSNGLGCYRLPDGYIQADFGWSAQTVSKAFRELFQIDFCERCESTFFVLIPKYLKWNPISNGNVASAREKEFRSVPSKASVNQRLAINILEYGKHLTEGFENRLETLSKGYGKQDPTRPDPEPDQKGPETNGQTPKPPDRFSAFWDAYPKRVKKQDARKKWKAKRLDEKADEIIEDIERRKRTDKRWLDGFVPDPTTYINGERWEDEITQPKSAASAAVEYRRQRQRIVPEETQ